MRLLSVKTYHIPGDPIPLQRPRYKQQGKPWDSQKAQKHDWMNQLEEQHGNEPLFSGPVLLTLIFRFKIPKVHEDNHDVLVDTHHFYTPDLDNLIKFALDCGQGVIYKDDRIVSEIHAVKMYGAESCTDITVVPFVVGTKIDLTPGE